MAWKKPPTKAPYVPGQPGAWAVCRFQCDGDWAAAALLYRLKWRWGQKNKLRRLGLEWIAESSREWALGAGLSFYEFRDHALPRLRKMPFVEVRQMKLHHTGPKLLWMSLRSEELPGTLDGAYEFYEARMKGMKVIGSEKLSTTKG